MRPITKGMLAVFLSSLGYGVLPILAKLALDEGVRVIPLLTWRFLLGSLLVWAFAAIVRRPFPARERVPGLAALGVLYAGNALAYMLGLDRISASLASLVFFTYPAVTVLMARLWAAEPLTAGRLGALALTTLGGAFTAGRALGGGDAAGIGLILLGVMLLATFIVASHSRFAGVPPVAGTGLLLGVTGAVLGVAGLAMGGLGLPPGPRPILLIAALGLVSTAVPVTLFLLGIQWIGPGRAAIFSTIEPAFTLALAALVLGDRLSPIQWLGAALILGGVVWLRLERPRPVRRVPAAWKGGRAGLPPRIVGQRPGGTCRSRDSRKPRAPGSSG